MKRSKKVRLDIYRTQIRPSDDDIDSYQDRRRGFRLANCGFRCGKVGSTVNFIIEIRSCV